MDQWVLCVLIKDDMSMELTGFYQCSIYLSLSIFRSNLFGIIPRK